MNLRRSARLVLLLAAALASVACQQHGERGARREGGAIPVEFVRALPQTVPVTVTAAGRMSSPHSVTITAQVTGRLKKAWVASGQAVRRGQLLFTLDSASYRAALAQARAKLRGDEAQVRYSVGQVRALAPLVAKDYVTRQTYDQAVATAQADRALVAQDRAAVETARLNLSYTMLHAPISGRLGVISLQPGNAVQADTTALVTLKQMSPLLVDFSLPQALLPRLRGLANEDRVSDLVVSHEDDGKVLASGRLTAVDNGVNTNTGTVSLQGRVDNPDEVLWPGEFVTVRLTLDRLHDALVLPAGAVQPGQRGSFVYVVKDGKAQLRNVTVRLVSEGKAVIDAGLKPREEVIYPIPARMHPGAKVRALGPHADDQAHGREEAHARDHAR